MPQPQWHQHGPSQAQQSASVHKHPQVQGPSQPHPQLQDVLHPQRSGVKVVSIPPLPA